MHAFGGGGYFWKEPTVFKKNPTFEAGAHFPDNSLVTFGTPLAATRDFSLGSDGTRPEFINYSGQDAHFRQAGLVVFRYNGNELRLTDNIYGSRGTGGYTTDYGERFTGTAYIRNLISGYEAWQHNSVEKIRSRSTERRFLNGYFLSWGTGGSASDSYSWYDGTDLTIRAVSGDIYLNVNQAGGFYVKFGIYAGITTEALAGFVRIQDAAGNIRKLAVVA